jgi:hypothetical protein
MSGESFLADLPVQSQGAVSKNSVLRRAVNQCAAVTPKNGNLTNDYNQGVFDCIDAICELFEKETPEQQARECVSNTVPLDVLIRLCEGDPERKAALDAARAALNCRGNENEALRDMLEDARREYAELAAALGIEYEPHQSFHERVVEYAKRHRAELSKLRNFATFVLRRLRSGMVKSKPIVIDDPDAEQLELRTLEQEAIDALGVSQGASK